MTEPVPETDPLAPYRGGDRDASGDRGRLDRALALVRYLRDHCPWDAEQTPESLIPHLIEEAAEVAHAIREGGPSELEGELGDLLLNLAFQIVIGEERGQLDAASVAARVEEKMRRRHPHLFGQGGRGSGEDGGGTAHREADQDAESEDDPPAWEALKALERDEEEGALSGLAPGLPPLLAAFRMQERAAGVGFDWPDPNGPLAKVAEELEEVRAALDEAREARHEAPEAPDRGREAGGRAGAAHAHGRLESEVGDLLFAVVNLARLAGVHPETALARANRKFRERFERLEALARERGLVVGEASLDELDALWDEIKEREG